MNTACRVRISSAHCLFDFSIRRVYIVCVFIEISAEMSFVFSGRKVADGFQQHFHLPSACVHCSTTVNKTITINEINYYCAHLRLIYISDFMIIVCTEFLVVDFSFSSSLHHMSMGNALLIGSWHRTTIDLLCLDDWFALRLLILFLTK